MRSRSAADQGSVRRVGCQLHSEDKEDVGGAGPQLGQMSSWAAPGRNLSREAWAALGRGLARGARAAPMPGCG
jgi:hypothetical protein